MGHVRILPTYPTHLTNLTWLVPEGGFEPPTPRL